MSDLDDIKALDSNVAHGINTADASLIAAQYTDDATILPPGVPLITGKTPIQAFWQGGIDMGMSDVSITPSSIKVHGDTSITVGIVQGKAGDAVFAGKYVVIGKKTAAGWKIHQDIWNMDA